MKLILTTLKLIKDLNAANPGVAKSEIRLSPGTLDQLDAAIKAAESQENAVPFYADCPQCGERQTPNGSLCSDCLSRPQPKQENEAELSKSQVTTDEKVRQIWELKDQIKKLRENLCIVSVFDSSDDMIVEHRLVSSEGSSEVLAELCRKYTHIEDDDIEIMKENGYWNDNDGRYHISAIHLDSNGQYDQSPGEE